MKVTTCFNTDAWSTNGRTGILYNTKRCPMPTETTYTSLRENLASVLDQVVDQQETVIVRRRGARDVALVPATELAGLIETAHLLRSPRNARRLLAALRRAERGKQKPATIAELRREILGARPS
jgi:antitoxin YefM